MPSYPALATIDSPPQRLAPFTGPDDTLREMVRAALGLRGEQSILIRTMKDHIVRKLQPKDYLGEILAVRYFAAEKIRYSNDALGVEQVQDPQRIAEEIIRTGNAVGDCFPEGTLLWRLEPQPNGTMLERFVAIEDVQVGDRIWGLDRWSVVEAKADKGVLRISYVVLNTGVAIPLTADHKVYVLRCPNHDRCDCPRGVRTEERIKVSELLPGMVLTCPEEVADVPQIDDLVKVVAVEHDSEEKPCWDIQTDDHRVYLADYGVTVSNCDDIATFIGALCRQLGREVEFVVVGFGAPGNYSHVFARVFEPKSKLWIVCDPVAGTGEAEMLRKVTTWKSVKVDV